MRAARARCTGMAWQYWRFTSLRANGYGLDLRNWHAWLECLCRLGQLDDATRYFCLEMNSGPQGVSLDEQGARILLKFANQRGVGDEVRTRVQRFLPALGKASIEYRARTSKVMGGDGSMDTHDVLFLPWHHDKVIAEDLLQRVVNCYLGLYFSRDLAELIDY
jgi:pentatricopeptide repeat protein